MNTAYSPVPVRSPDRFGEVRFDYDPVGWKARRNEFVFGKVCQGNETRNRSPPSV